MSREALTSDVRRPSAGGSPVSGARFEPRAGERRFESGSRPVVEAPRLADAAEGRARRLRNHVKRLRDERELIKAGLARKAGLFALAMDRVGSGMPCRMNTKRETVLALGSTATQRHQAFAPCGEDEGGSGSP